MRLLASGATDVGLKRTSNEDNFYIDPDHRFFIVADGMGGHAAGEEASRIAIETIRAYLEQQWQGQESLDALLLQALTIANEAILREQQTNPQQADMGTTVVLSVVHPQDQDAEAKALHCSHVGDSRLYRLRDELIEQITEDHTLVNQVQRSGMLTPEQARAHPLRHVLSQCLGRPELNDLTVQTFELLPGDRILICSDGLTEELSDDAIQKHLGAEECQLAVEDLIEAAKAHGGHDNITVIVLEALEDS